MPRERPVTGQLAWIVFVAFALRLAGILLLHTYRIKPELDHFTFGYETGRIARSIVLGLGFANPFETPTGLTAWGAPLYPYLTAGVFKIFGIYSQASALVLLGLNSLFSALTCVPMYFIARPIFGRRVANWSAWFWALFPGTMFWAVKWVWETSLSALLLAVIFLLTMEMQRSATLRRWIIFGFLWGIAALTNTSLISFLPVTAIWLAYRLWRQHRRWVLGGILSALIFCGVIAPWTIRNYEVFHKFIFIRSNFGAELRMGNAPDAEGFWLWYIHPTTNVLQFEKYQQMGEVAYVAERKHEAVEWIRHNPGRFASVTLRRIWYFWADTPTGSQHPISNLMRNSLFLASSVLAFWGLGLAIRRRKPASLLFTGLLLAFPLVYYVVFPHPRYRHPIEPEMVILAAYLISETREMKSRMSLVTGRPMETRRPTSMSIVIPVYNEAATIASVVEAVLASDAGLRKEIVIVDDCSRDGTRDVLQELERELKDNGCSIKLLFHDRNQGKGAAIRTGLAHVTGDVVIVQDADLEYDPQDYPRLLEPIMEGRADVVFGNRFHGGGPHRVLYFWHFQANRLLTFFCNFLTNLNLSDMEVGYKVFRREIITRLKLKSNRFGFEPEVTIKTAKLGCRIYEVPIAYHGRTYEEGKKIGWKDGIAAIWHMIKYRYFG